MDASIDEKEHISVEKDKFAQRRCGATVEGSAKSRGDDAGTLGGTGWHEEIEHFSIGKWAL